MSSFLSHPSQPSPITHSILHVPLFSCVNADDETTPTPSTPPVTTPTPPPGTPMCSDGTYGIELDNVCCAVEVSSFPDIAVASDIRN